MTPVFKTLTKNIVKMQFMITIFIFIVFILPSPVLGVVCAWIVRSHYDEHMLELGSENIVNEKISCLCNLDKDNDDRDIATDTIKVD